MAINNFSPLGAEKFRFTFVSVLAILFGVGLLNHAARMAISLNDYLSTAVAVEAQILGVNYRQAKFKNAVMYTEARIQFTTENGDIVETSIMDAGATDITTTSKTVRVRYQPQDPAHPRTEAELWNLNELVLSAIGGVISICLGYVAGKKRGSSPVARGK